MGVSEWAAAWQGGEHCDLRETQQGPTPVGHARTGFTPEMVQGNGIPTATVVVGF